MRQNQTYGSRKEQSRRGTSYLQGNNEHRHRNDHDIYHRHYERGDDDFHDRRRDYDSGRPNYSNHGMEMYEGHDLNRGYGYNQGRNSSSNVGGRAYGQSYGQYFQGSDLRSHSNPRDYEGDFDPSYRERAYNREDDFNDRYDEDQYDFQWEFRHPGYQGSGYNEGFGQRGGHRNERQCLDEDGYRGGHAQRHSGFGKYGSR
jgi:hypothetical protein